MGRFAHSFPVQPNVRVTGDLRSTAVGRLLGSVPGDLQLNHVEGVVLLSAGWEGCGLLGGDRALFKTCGKAGHFLALTDFQCELLQEGLRALQRGLAIYWGILLAGGAVEHKVAFV